MLILALASPVSATLILRNSSSSASNFGCKPVLSFSTKVDRGGGVLHHFDFGLVIGPGLVAELAGDVVAQDENFLQQRNVFLAGEVVVRDEKLFARVLAFRVVQHA